MASQSDFYDRIEAYVAKHDRAKATHIAAAFGMEIRPITRALVALAEKRRIFKVDVQAQHGVYSVHPPVTKRHSPRYVPEFREMTRADYDIWSHQRMAVEGR